MTSNLSDLLNLGKKSVIGLSLLALSSCASFQARKDYGFDPVHRKQVARYNITQILKENCQESEVTDNSLRCERKKCTSSYSAVSRNSTTGQYTTVQVCSNWEYPVTRINFDEIKSITSDQYYIRFNSSPTDNSYTAESKSIPLRSHEQAKDLEQAINIYLEKDYVPPKRVASEARPERAPSLSYQEPPNIKNNKNDGNDILGYVLTGAGVVTFILGASMLDDGVYTGGTSGSESEMIAPNETNRTLAWPVMSGGIIMTGLGMYFIFD